MFSSAVQPSIVSLFSSTGSNPLDLFAAKFDPNLPSDSFISLLKDSTALPTPAPPRSLVSPLRIVQDEECENVEGYRLHHAVLHLQSPTLRTTYIRCPQDDTHLGLKHPWVHFQARNMGREWSFEVGIVDRSNREGVVRCSTFQREPKLRLGHVPPLLHLPLAFPATSAHLLTTWNTITLHLPSFLPYFTSQALAETGADEDEDGDNSDEEIGSKLSRRRRAPQSPAAQVPGGTYSHVSYVKVYATCRLRRIWFSEVGPGPDQHLPWEFQLFTSK